MTAQDVVTNESGFAAKIEAYMRLAGCTMDEAELHVRRLTGGSYDVDALFRSVARVDPSKTFENYIGCPQNEFPLELLSQIAEDRAFGRKYSPLYIYAAVGLGKTHLLSAVMNSVKGQNMLFINTAELEVVIESARQRNGWAEFRDYFKKLDLLCIDDIQLCEGSPSLQREIFAIINAIVEEKRIVLISSDVPPTRLKNIEQRLISRLGGGVIVTLSMGDASYRREILSVAFPELRSYAKSVTWLSETFSSSVRDLLAAARTIKAYIGSQNREPESLEMAALLGVDLNRSRPPASPPKRQPEPGNHLHKFKQMLDGAESEEEYYLAIQIAINTRLTELRRGEGSADEIAKFERAMELVQRRELHEVMKLIGM